MQTDHPRRALLWIVGIAFALAVADQVLKQIVLGNFVYGETMTVIPGFFTLTYLRNPGAVFGVLAGQGMLLILFSLVSVLALLIFHSRIAATLRSRIALGLMIGGILGNFVDRLAYGFVVDFLDFHIMNRHWPAFNLADAAICTGIGLYLLDSFLAARLHKDLAHAQSPKP